MKSRNVVIAGGGTGGHIYPGLVLAQELGSSQPQIKVHFVGSCGGLEEKIIPSKYPLHLFKVGPLHSNTGFLQRFRSLFLLPVCVFQSILLYIRLKPLWVLGIGGFASGPFVFTAALLGGRCALLEPNAHPGWTNRWLSWVVRFCFVVFERSGRFFPNKKVRVVGLPVRWVKCRQLTPYDPCRPFRVLIFGGSQGARAVNRVVGEWVESLGEKCLKTGPCEFQVVHQVGHRDYELWKKRYGQKYNSFLDYRAFIPDMGEKMRWADLVICRSGVGSVVEVAMAGKPALFIPLPTASDNHQEKNAQFLVDLGGAYLSHQKDFNVKGLKHLIDSFKNHPEKGVEMQKKLQEVDHSSATSQILETLMTMTRDV